MKIIGNIKTGINSNPSQHKQMTPQEYNAMLQTKQPQAPDHIGADIGGTVGGTIGQIVGTPLDLISGPAGTAAGGAVGGGLGGAIGEGIQQLASGKGINFGDLFSEAGQNAALSAIPGEPEANLGVKLLTRLGAGALTQAGATVMKNHQEGKPITDDLLNNMLTGGVVNSILPAATEPISHFLFGDAKKITQDIASKLVGEQAAKDPEILKRIDFGNPDKTIQNLTDYAQQVYKPVSDAIAKSNTTLGDFFDAITNKGRTYLSDMQRNDFRNALGHAEDVASGKAKDMVAFMREMISSDAPAKVPNNYRDIQIPMKLAHEFKKQLNFQVNPDLYTNIDKFIDTSVKKQTGVDMQKADTLWNTIMGRHEEHGVPVEGAVKKITKLRESAGGANIKTGQGLDWSQRAQVMLGAAFLSHLLGLGGSGAEMLGAPLMIKAGMKPLMTETAPRAKGYTQALATQPVTKITQQISQRLVPFIQQTIQDIMGGGGQQQNQQNQQDQNSPFGQ